MEQKKTWFSIVPIMAILLVLLSACNNQQSRTFSEPAEPTTTQRVQSEEVLDQEKNLTFCNQESDLVSLKNPKYLQSYNISNFEIILQNPELPTGCEITAMTMLLNYYGLQADKVIMATRYLPTTPLQFYYGKDGQLYGSDLKQYFLGDPTEVTGYVCGTTAITTAANRFLQDKGSALTSVDKTGITPEGLYQFVSQDIPVVVWITIDMEDRSVPQGWYIESGEYVDWSLNDHAAVLIGYTEDTVTIADPISGRVEYSKQQFEKVFLLRGSQCVILQ